MTDLTEQWQKGELPEGFYYVKDGENMIAEYLDGYFYNNGEPMTSFSGGVDKVLAKVPTYEEYQALLSDQLAKNEGVEINAELKAENNKLKSRLDYITTASDYDIERLQEDCHTLAQKILQVKPELREWLEVNYKEYL